MPYRAAPVAPEPRGREDQYRRGYIKGDGRDNGASDPGGLPPDQRREHRSRAGRGARQREQIGKFALAGPALYRNRLLRDIGKDRIAAAERQQRQWREDKGERDQRIAEAPHVSASVAARPARCRAARGTTQPGPSASPTPRRTARSPPR